jgi:hypothetical protein
MWPSTRSLCSDCWSVAFGNSFNDEERCVLAGYDNGDVKLFDLRMNQVRLLDNFFYVLLLFPIMNDFKGHLRKRKACNSFCCTIPLQAIHL